MKFFRFILSIITILSLFSGGVLVLCGIVAWIYSEESLIYFAISGLILLGVGSAIAIFSSSDTPIRARDGFVITSLSYIGLGLFSALPLWLLASDPMSFTDAAFEAVSGLTTTGATVLSGLDEMDKSFLFYRQILQWFGGMGIILLAVAILPLLGIGGMQLFRAEASAAAQQSNIKPRIRETAKTLWMIYIGITAVCTMSYWATGMTFFDAICHAFSTVAIGGFSTHDGSFGHFDSLGIEIVCLIFMIVAAVNFTLHFTSWHQFWNSSKTAVRMVVKQDRRGNFDLLTQGGFKQAGRIYLNDYEFRLFGALLVVLVVFTCINLKLHLDPSEFSIRDGIFQAVSFLTTTGYTTASYSHWPLSCTFLLILSAFAGGCVGSTAGGLKMLRVFILFQQGLREIHRLLYPNSVVIIKLHRNAVPDRVVEAVWGLFAVYVATFFILLCFVLFISDLDLETSFSAVAACLNNLGPGLGAVSETYQGLSDPVKWTLTTAMILGRLEIITLLILLTPKFWRT